MTSGNPGTSRKRIEGGLKKTCWKCANNVLLRKNGLMRQHPPLNRDVAAEEGVIVCPASGTDYYVGSPSDPAGKNPAPVRHGRTRRQASV